MKKKLFQILPILVLSVAMISFPAVADSRGGQASIKATEIVGYRHAPAPDVNTLPELQPVADSEMFREQAPAGYAKLYWKVSSFWCATGGRIYISVDGVYKGYVKKSGTYYVGLISTARTHRLYAKDRDSSSVWGPASYYIYSFWTKFTWTTKC